jgi:hypothetical protein
MTGGRVVYRYRQPSGNPPATITLKMDLQGTGLSDYATLTWRYTPEPQPPQAASPAQPQTLAKSDVPAQERTLAKAAPQAAPQAPATSNAGDLRGLWTITVTSQKGAWTSLARATQEGDRVTFRAQSQSGAEAGDVMRGTLVGANLEVEFGNAQGATPGRGSLTYNPRTGEFEGDVVSTGLPVHLKITRAR